MLQIWTFLSSIQMVSCIQMVSLQPNVPDVLYSNVGYSDTHSPLYCQFDHQLFDFSEIFFLSSFAVAVKISSNRNIGENLVGPEKNPRLVWYVAVIKHLCRTGRGGRVV